MSKNNIVKYISLGGVLTSITVLLQSAPIFLPAVGLIISPLSTLPVAVASLPDVVMLVIMVMVSKHVMLCSTIPQA